MKLNLTLIGLLLVNCHSLIAQKDSSIFKDLTISGYLETYYSFDFAQPGDNERPGLFYSFDRHNEINVNVGFLKAEYKSDRVKSNLALMTGTYAKSNLAHEPGIYRMILEANLSIQPFEKKNGWLTVGVFPSHLGFESAVGADCWNLTRSISAESSPYYLAGIKYETRSKNDRWRFGITVSNGWQRIQRQPGNSLIGIGHQLTYEPTEKLTFNSSSYVGSEFPDSLRRMRYFHDFYTLMEVTKRFHLIAGFDIGWEQTTKGSAQYSTWFTPTLITKLILNDKFNLAARAEYYNDQDEVIITTNDGEGFATLGFSLNLDYSFTNRVLFRIEGRTLQSDRGVYFTNGVGSNSNTFVTTSLSVRF